MHKSKICPEKFGKNSEMEFMNELEAEVNEIRNNTVSAKSRAVYVNSNVNFIRWLHEHKRHLLNGEFIAASDNMSKASIKRLLIKEQFTLSCSMTSLRRSS